ncbi:hypothetical protein KSP39_PZI011021 [Platanthera zijinensis]|uniref:Uncharacterized protein n=1 Tax=Platanthera zijinensis TaxID=2320716 RepID=A0AAP0BGD6_9ASPA
MVKENMIVFVPFLQGQRTSRYLSYFGRIKLQETQSWRALVSEPTTRMLSPLIHFHLIISTFIMSIIASTTAQMHLLYSNVPMKSPPGILVVAHPIFLRSGESDRFSLELERMRKQ